MNPTSEPVETKVDGVVDRRSRQNAIVLFVLFLLQPIALVVFVCVRLAGSPAFDTPYAWIRDFGVIGGVFALFYLPVQWHAIRQMRTFHRLAALVGGGGLILLLLIHLPAIIQMWRGT